MARQNTSPQNTTLQNTSPGATGTTSASSMSASSTAGSPEQVRLAQPRRSRVWPRVVGVLILLLGAGGAFLWQNPQIARRYITLPPTAQERETEEARIRTLEARLARLEQRPAPVDPTPALAARLDALEKLQGRVNALEQRPEPAAPTPAPAPAAAPAFDPGPLQTRLEALEARTAMPLMASNAVDLRPYIARIAALEQRVSKPAADPEKLTALSARVDDLAAGDTGLRTRVEAVDQAVAKLSGESEKLVALSARVEALGARDPTVDLRARVDGLEKQLTGVAANAGKVTEVSDRIARVARLRAATLALNAGQKLGPIPDAPPALMRFANAPPPTETALRLAFPAAEQAALAVSQPDTGDKPFLDRVMARLQDYRLITVRQGNTVLLGNPTAETLTRAHGLLDAGDLAGAVREVSTLTGDSARAMGQWLDNAKALLLARDALATLAMAGNG